jgi:glycosyltransferase involved in cell wall biosynthesis
LKTITFVHPSFEVVGGAEKVALKFMEAAAEEGLAVNLVTFDDTSIKNFLKKLSSKTTFRLWKYPYMDRIPSINRGIIQGLILYPVLKRMELERSIIVNTKFNEMPTLGDAMYIHYPFYFVAAKNPLDKSLIEGPALNKAVSNPMYATYVKASGIVGSRISWSYIRQASKVFFNSIYTYTLFRYYTTKEQNDKYGVLNPPIDDVYFEESIQEKGEVIVMRTKGVNPQIVSDIVLKLAQSLRKWNVYIIGFADKLYYEALKQKLSNASNVKIVPNIDEKAKRRLLSKATLYVHLTPYEHFGILIGEALASGCKVVVHRFSGIIYDIALEHSQPTIESCINTYSRFHEIPYIIENNIKGDGYNPRVCRSLVVQFSENSFKKKAREIIERIT